MSSTFLKNYLTSGPLYMHARQDMDGESFDTMPQGSDDSSGFESNWSPRRGSSVILKIDEEGQLKPLSDKMQARLRELASRDDWKSATGLNAASGNAVTDKSQEGKHGSLILVDDDKAKAILKGLESMKQMFWSLIGLSEAKRTEIIHYSEAQKDLFAPPLARVINKRSPDWIKKYWDEVQLAMFMGTVELGQFQMCAKALADERKQKQRGPAVVRPIAPEPRTEVRQEQRETVASADARAEVAQNFEICAHPQCVEPAVPGMTFCRMHRQAVES